MEYVRQYDDVRLVVQLDVHGRVEAAGEEIDLGQLGEVVAHGCKSLALEFAHTLFRAEYLAPSL